MKPVVATGLVVSCVLSCGEVRAGHFWKGGTGPPMPASMASVGVLDGTRIFATPQFGAQTELLERVGGAWTTVRPGGSAASQPVVSACRQSDGNLILSDIAGARLTWRSTDAGATWQESTFVVPPGSAATPALLSAAYATPDVVYGIGLVRGLWKSTDAGATFQAISTDEPYGAVAVSPANPSALYAARRINGVGVKRSTDAGATWGPYSTTAPGASALAVSPNSDDVVFLAGPLGTWKSTDGGMSWAGSFAGMIFVPTTDIQFAYGSADVLWSGTYSHGAYRSTDSGSTWAAVGPPETSVTRLGAVSADECYYSAAEGLFHVTGPSWAREPGPVVGAVRHLDASPDAPGTALAGGSAGLFRTTDEGATWTAASGLPAAWITGAAFDPHDGSRAYVAVGPDIFRSTDAGITWAAVAGWSSVRQSSSHDISFFFVDRTAHTGVWARIDDVLFHSTDGGETWISSLRSSAVDAALTPAAPDTIALAQYVVTLSTDGGATWAGSLPGGGESGVRPSAIAIDPDDPSRVYLGTRWSGFFASENGGFTWQPRSSPDAAFPATSITALAVLPGGALLASTSTGVFRSPDRGVSWANAGGGIAAPGSAKFAVSTCAPGKVFLGTSIGFYVHESSPAGDVNGDGGFDVADVFALLNALFAGGAPPLGPADANGDGTVDVLDVFYLINTLFAGGPAPSGVRPPARGVATSSSSRSRS